MTARALADQKCAGSDMNLIREIALGGLVRPVFLLAIPAFLVVSAATYYLIAFTAR